MASKLLSRALRLRVNCGLFSPKSHAPSANARLFLSRTTHDGAQDRLPPGRFPIPDKSTLDADIVEALDEVEKKSGFLPNVFKVYTHRPEEFRAFFKYYDVLMAKETGTLTKAEKELIVVATSAQNNCLYCVVAHSALHRIYSKNAYIADQVSINHEAADLTDRERAIVNFALDIMAMNPIEEERYTELQKHGISEEDAWDIGAIASFFALSNRMAHMTKMRPNSEFHLIGRVPKDK